MDINTLRIVSTLLCFAIFIGILVWAFSARQKESFKQAAQLPFDENKALADRRIV